MTAFVGTSLLTHAVSVFNENSQADKKEGKSSGGFGESSEPLPNVPADQCTTGRHVHPQAGRVPSLLAGR
jgi:hypothetical protein